MARSRVTAPAVETTAAHRDRIDVTLRDGTALVFSDCHYDPGAPPSTAHRAVVALAKRLRPDLLICGGDALDGASISRHPRIMWEDRPKLVDELAEVQQRLREIERASPKARRLWNLGNHDIRLAQYLSANAGAVEGLFGTQLEDFFPSWETAWATWVNPDAQIPCVLKHRWHGGAQAARSNAIKAGTHIVTGHTHHLQIVAHTDWAGTRFAVDTGCVSDVNSRLFSAYTEKGCTGWRSGAAVLSFASSEMLPPELIQVIKESSIPGHGQAWFRGKLFNI